MSGKRREKGSRSKRGRSRGSPHRRAGAGARTSVGDKGGAKPADPFAGQLWDALRQGARNVAGVRYQLAVTAHLLVESRLGSLSFIEVIPEGYEDIDCLDRDSLHWFVQVKEVGAGAGNFTASSVAEVISHAASAASSGSRIVAVTDAQLGGQVAESGWGQSISQTTGYDIESTVQALVGRGHSRGEAEELVTRSHLVRLPWNATPMTTKSLATCYSINRAAAAIVASRLLEDLGQVAADQRDATADCPGRRDLNDLDALVKRVMTVIDVDSLDSAVRLGVCDIADYTADPGSDLAAFLLGVDVVPSHIGANFDVIRPGPTRAVQVGLEEGRYVLVAGPSGSGKSAQMWRSARDVSPGARVVRVHRLETEADVDELVRYVQLLEPGAVGRVVVCCDDLGRPQAARWPLAARRLLEQRGVMLLGAVRQEDFTAELLRHGGELVELSLDDATAIAIAEQLAYAGVRLLLEVPEAVERAERQLMEYVALLTTGKRMRAVLAAQAESLLQSDDPAGAEVARLVCAAHVLGVSLDASSLEKTVSVEQPSLSQALRRLHDEHIVTSEDRASWHGLHQRRSDVLTDLLHETPPPALSETMGVVLRSVRSAALGWSLRRMVELFPDLPADQSAAVEAAVSECSSAEDLAILFEALERADNSLSARSFIPVLERYRRDQVPLLHWAMLVCGDKFAGIRFGSGGDSILDKMGQHVHGCAEELPARSTTYCDAAAATGSDRLVQLLAGALLEDAVRLLEAAAPYVQLPGEELQQLAAAFPWPNGVLDPAVRSLHGRLRAAACLACGDEVEFAQAFGSVDERLYQAGRSSPSVVSAALGEDDQPQATVELLAHPSVESESPRFAWDLERNSGDSNDATNRNAVDLATFVGECCPEIEVVEVVTILADGGRLRLGDLEPGYKRLAKDARPRRDLVRTNVGVQAAISRQAAAYSWTELVRLRTQIAMLVGGLTQEAPRRLGVNDNPRRRAEWLSELERVDQLLAVLPRPPAVSELDIGSVAASWDAEREEEGLSAALRSVVGVLGMLVPRAGGRLVPAGAGGQARDAARKVRDALSESGALTTTEEREAYADLGDDLGRLGNLLAALAFDPTVSRGVKGSPDEFASILDRLIEEAAQNQLESERQDLEGAFRDVSDAVVIQMPDEDPFLTSVAGHQWLVTVPPEGWEAVLSVAAARESRVADVPISVVCDVDGTFVPIAARLSTMFPAGLLPLGPESVEHFASILDKRTVGGPALTLVGAVARELVLASWENARLRMRPSEWPTPEGDPHEHLTEARRRAANSEPDERDVLGSLEDLVARVGIELEGGDGVPIAAELAGPELLGGAAVGEVHAMADVTQAVVLALDLELARATAQDEEQ